MSNERVEQIRQLVLSQLEGVLKVAGDDIKGSTLELRLRLAIEEFKALESNEFNVKGDNVAPQPAPVDRAYRAYEQMHNNYEDDNDYDEDYYDEDEYERARHIPEGFDNAEQYEDFLAEQNNLANGMLDAADTVVGNVPVDGEYRAVGNMDESLNRVTNIIEENHTIRDEETDEVLYHNEVPEVPTIKVSFTRNDNMELTNHHILDTIMSDRIAQTMVESFGDDYEIHNGPAANQKIVVFNINNNDDKQKRISQGLTHGNGVMNFAGRHVFPGIGLVTAQTIL